MHAFAGGAKVLPTNVSAHLNFCWPAILGSKITTTKSGTDYLAGKGLQRPRDSLGINLGDLRHVVIAVISIQVGQRLVLLKPAPTDVHKGNGDPQRNGREDGGSDGCCDADV